MRPSLANERFTMKRWCKICEKFEEDIHEHVWLSVPDSCVCYPRTWVTPTLDAIPAICDKYVGNGLEECEECEHDPECHV